MVDGDQLNVVIDPTIISVAERNLKEFNVIPLFYDAAKAKPENISKESQFHGLKRAHLYSNIGEISNMLTRLWNRDNPDREAAALLTALNNWRIDGAKTGAVNEYTNYPEIEKKINKAIGGPNGRLPFFFQYTKNGRRDKTTGKKNRQWAKINDSTMNRICKAFDDIGNINMNWAKVAPFNWRMLMSSPCHKTRMDIVSMFCDLDNIKVSIAIADIEESPAEKELFKNNGILEEYIVYMLTKNFGSIEECYPYITKYLFSGENVSKSTHKQTYWKIFGDIAIRNIQENLKSFKTCPLCGAKVPSWTKYHSCPKDTQGFYECNDCGKICRRKNARQCRCDQCQEDYRKEAKRISYYKTKQERKERDGLFTSFLPLRCKKTL